MFNILVKYPSFEQELAIINETTGSTTQNIQKIISAEEILFFQNLVRKTPIAPNVVEYAVKIIFKNKA